MASMKPKKSSLPPPKPRPRQSITVGKQRGVNGRIIIGVVVAAVLVLGVVIALVVGGGDDDDGETLGSIPVAQCDAEDVADTADTAVAGSAEDADVELADFAAGEIPQAVAVDGDPLDPYGEAIINGQTADTALCARAPVVSGYDYAGEPVTIDAAVDGPTMVVLLAHWCPHCNAEIPRLNEWRDAGNVPEGLNIVGVSTGIDSERPNYPPDEWLESKDWQWSVLADSAEATAFQAFGGQFFPTAVIIGSDGRVLLRFSGEPSAEEIDDLVRAALAADPANA